MIYILVEFLKYIYHTHDIFSTIEPHYFLKQDSKCEYPNIIKVILGHIKKN
jgi:hypothetical protein